MSIRDYGITAFISAILTPVVLLSMQLSFAQVMQSSNYRIESDSVNFGGGLSTSTNYNLESTMGEVATGDSSGTEFNLRAGYQQLSGRFISMTTPAPVSMSPSIPGITGGAANGSTTVVVVTDSSAGYSLSIRAESSPALMKGSDFIADYVPTGDPDLNFAVGSSDAHFGFSPSGQNIVSRFRDDGFACATGSSDTPLSCWDGLSTTDARIAQSTSANTPNGATTTVYFRVWVGDAVLQPGGTYTATTTLTALAQ